MKRSDMVILIAEVISGQDFFIDKSPISQSDMKLADYLLNKIEQKGMLPPIHYPYKCMCSMRGSCPDCNPNEYKMYNNWETGDV